MDELQLKSIWNAYDKKLERSLQLNIKLLENLQTDKAKSKLGALLSVKIIGVIIGIIWVLFLGILVYGNRFSNVYFTVSVALVMLFSIVAIAAYIQHIVVINRIDYTASITDTQSKLAKLQVSTIQSTRFVWLQLPFYSTFFWNRQWISQNDPGFWLGAVPVTIVLTLLAIYLYINISPANLHKPWVKKIMMVGIEYKYALAASDLLQEIADFKRDEN